MAEWISLEKAIDKLPSKPGVYIIRQSKNRKPVEIGRLKGVDQQGILYIGSASDLRKRVRNLLGSLEGKYRKIKHTMTKSYIFFSLDKVIKIMVLSKTIYTKNNNKIHG